jgi:cytochrome c-type biogenesis protein CcmE
MSHTTKKYVKFGAAITVIVLALVYVGYTGVQENKSYYVSVKELHAVDNSLYTKHLRLYGVVQPGSIHQVGTNAEFVLVEVNGSETQHVSYKGSEPPPDTFKDEAEALAIGSYGRDGMFHANEVQAKCASKYAPKQQKPVAPAQPRSSQPQSKGY